MPSRLPVPGVWRAARAVLAVVLLSMSATVGCVFAQPGTRGGTTQAPATGAGTSAVRDTAVPAIPYPQFSFDSVRYYVRTTPAMRQGLTGMARCVVRLDARGRVTTTFDERTTNEQFRNSLADGLKYVSFRPALVAGRPVASAVTITAWFLLDTSRSATTPFVDIAVDSAAKAAGPIVRSVRRNGVPIELAPVYNRAELASNLYYPRDAQHGPTPDTVIVRALVDRAGNAGYTIVESSSNPMLTALAEEAVKATRFTPSLQMGSPVAVWTSVPVVFNWGK